MCGGMIPWREAPGRGRGQNDERCKPGSGTESKVHGTCALGKSPKPGLGTCQKKFSIMVMESTNEKWVMSKEVCHSPMVWGLSITVGCAMVCECWLSYSHKYANSLDGSGFNELCPYRIQKYHQSASDGGTSEEEDPCHRKEENEWSEDEEVNKNSCFSSSSNVLVEDACFHIDLLHVEGHWKMNGGEKYVSPPQWKNIRVTNSCTPSTSTG